MGEENNIFSKFGKSEILFSLKDSPVRLSIVEGIIEESIELDRAKARKEALGNLIKAKSLTVSCDLKIKEKKYLELLKKEWMGTAMDEADALREVTLIIEGEPRINRPKNLKYPNKKRARRIWKKWRNRFGVTPTQRTIIPKATLSVTPAFRNNQQYCDIEAVVEKGEIE